MNPVTIAYHFFKNVQQNSYFKAENFLTKAENEKVSELTNFFEQIISSYDLIIETEHTLDLSESENTSESDDDFEDFRHPEKCKYSYEKMQEIAKKSETQALKTLRHQYKKTKTSIRSIMDKKIRWKM
ncbi:unnamed protein product [Rotaria sp. Silwood2]|nr:unnamed protein product [Rotaria sp. Silwood2]